MKKGDLTFRQFVYGKVHYAHFFYKFLFILHKKQTSPMRLLAQSVWLSICTQLAFIRHSNPVFGWLSHQLKSRYFVCPFTRTCFCSQFFIHLPPRRYSALCPLKIVANLASIFAADETILATFLPDLGYRGFGMRKFLIAFLLKIDISKKIVVKKCPKFHLT